MFKNLIPPLVCLLVFNATGQENFDSISERLPEINIDPTTPHYEIVMKSQIPEAQLKNMKTSELVKKVLNYPDILQVMAYNSFDEGLQVLIGQYNGLSELIKRTNCAAELISQYKKMNFKDNKYDDANGNGLTQFLIIELLLSQETIIRKLTAEQKRELINESYNKFLVKKQNKELFGFTALAPCAAIMKRGLQAVNYPLGYYTQSAVEGAYAGVDADNIDALLSDVKQFLKTK